MPTIYDNIEQQLFEGLNKTLDKAKRADFCIGYFNLRGWRKLSEKIDALTGSHLDEDTDDDNKYYCRVLVGMQKLPEDELREALIHDNKPSIIDNNAAKERKIKIAKEFRTQLVIGNPTNQDERALKQLSLQLKQRKVVVKLYLKNQLHAKLYLVKKDDYNIPIVGFVGSSNLTFSGMAGQSELNVDVTDKDAAIKLAKWYEDRWQDRWSIDITEELAQIIDESWASEKLFSPYHVYIKMAYHLSREARAGILEFELPKIFKKSLLEYQQGAVKVAAHHLNHRGGVIIGDVVGLGKTITATALAKMFEDDLALETLIICPKNLVDMWQDYAHKYQLRAKVLSITKVQNRLPKERRFRIVLIDESHNLRNRQGKRYRAIQEYIALNDSKVILLTATPYNKTYIDISSQLRLFMNEEHNLGISPEQYIESIGGKSKYRAKHQVAETSIAAFEHSEFPDDWSELMRLFLVRRTRSFIKNNYAIEDPEMGRKYLEFSDGTRSYFPDRIPKKVEYNFNPDDPTDQYARLYSSKIIDTIDQLVLPRYGLGQEVYEHQNLLVKIHKEEIKIKENLGRAGTRLIGFARTNLFKRLESSGYSFLLSISRHILRNYLFIYAIENKKAFPIGKQEAGLIDDFMYIDNEDDSEVEDINKYKISILTTPEQYLQQAELYYDSLYTKKHRYQWIRSELFSEKLKQDLLADSAALMSILAMGKDWEQKNDRQLNALYDLIMKTHKNEKVLIFTQFADTAFYLNKSLIKRGVDKLACVTGSHDNPTSFAHRFSPKSNDAIIEKEKEIRVLITTDVLSEGQNLQDAHIVLNFDLPWAIIRLIQRAGRVDRIGQKNHEILCYSFLPEDGIENIINLRGRLSQRIKENAETVGSDEVFFEGDPINIADLYNEKSGLLDDEEEVEVDLASQAYQIWKNAIEAQPELEQIIPNLPNVIYATKKASPKQNNSGAIVYIKTKNDTDTLAWVDQNYNIVTQSQSQILKAIKCEPDEKPLERIDIHHDLVKKGLDHIRDVEKRVGGQLGKKTGARYKAYVQLSEYERKNKNSLWLVADLKYAIQAIHDHPLSERARIAISRQLKTGIDDQDLAKVVVQLWQEGELSLIVGEDSKNKEPQIICSLGLKVQ
ncbi:MAG: NgoFVII family restriction endonuclease [Bernardetiaceae bacterium]|nr:NgoFVII family restriction endonuclease [Bernardetiaceae bacterium]